MARSNFENLHVYRLSEQVADLVWKIVSGWNRFERETLGSQLIRAADSVGANIAEGVGRGTYRDNRRLVYIARGSLNETKHWLRCAFRRQLLTTEQTDQLRPLLDELGPRLNAYLRSIRDRKETMADDNQQPTTNN